MSQKIRIAHVDDDPDIRDTVGRILSMNGYEVDSYLTMADLIDTLEKTDPADHPDLAILDVMVESMDAGLNTYITLNERFPGFNAIFLTSLGEMIRPYFEGKSDEWVCIMEKPVEPVSLLAMVRNRLDHTEAATKAS